VTGSPPAPVCARAADRPLVLRVRLADVHGTEARDVRPRPGHDLWARVRVCVGVQGVQAKPQRRQEQSCCCLLAHARTHPPTRTPASRRSCPGTGVRSTTRRTRLRGADRRRPQRPCASARAPGRPAPHTQWRVRARDQRHDTKHKQCTPTPTPDTHQHTQCCLKCVRRDGGFVTRRQPRRAASERSGSISRRESVKIADFHTFHSFFFSRLLHTGSRQTTLFVRRTSPRHRFQQH
jgi:hypothetical protein